MGWFGQSGLPVGDQILDQDIKRAVDAQLAGKGLRRVKSDGDLYLGYQASISLLLFSFRQGGLVAESTQNRTGARSSLIESGSS